MKILEKLWYGNVAPGERSVDKGDRLWNLGRLILQNEEELAPLLSEKAKEVLEKLRDNQSELNDKRVRGVRLWVPARRQDHAGGAGRQRQVGRIRRINLVPRVRLRTNPPLSTDRKEVCPKM